MSRRKFGGRAVRGTILIVCEGEKTEPLYFEAFKVASVKVKGTGKNTMSLVDEAIRLKAENPDFDAYWCVFDRDSFPAQNFNAALQRANANGLQVAYTNEAFELWYLLHFSYCNTALSRRLYAEKLTERLGREYRKNDPTLYATLLPRLDDAIRNAARLLEFHGAAHNPERNNPSTMVHVLVEELRRLQGAQG